MNKTKDSRLEEFRQLKKGIRGSKEHLIVGIAATFSTTSSEDNKRSLFETAF